MFGKYQVSCYHPWFEGTKLFNMEPLRLTFCNTSYIVYIALHYRTSFCRCHSNSIYFFSRNLKSAMPYCDCMCCMYYYRYCTVTKSVIQTSLPSERRTVLNRQMHAQQYATTADARSFVRLRYMIMGGGGELKWW